MLLTNIAKLVGITSDSKHPKITQAMSQVDELSSAFLLIEDGLIKDFGSMDHVPEYHGVVKDCEQRLVMPCYVDSHSHLVFAESRAHEFKMRLEGKTYQEIAEAGGGILNSAARLASMSEDALYHISCKRLEHAVESGIGCMEIKSGYGLDLENELKMLRVIARLKENFGIPIKSTYLAAHALPAVYKNDKKTYIDLICSQWLPQIAEQKLADYVDLFCEEGYFDLTDMRRILEAGNKHNLKAKVHVNQFTSFGAIALAGELGALSVDHLEVMNTDDFTALEKYKSLITVGLPLCSLFLNIPYTPGRKLIDHGSVFVLASDFNPGSSPSQNLSLAFALACSQMKLNPEEAFNALTYNAAFAIEMQDCVGSIEKGKLANLMIMNDHVKGLEDIAYWFGDNPIKEVIVH